MITGLTFYLSVTRGLSVKPHFDYLWGKVTHFVHPDGDYRGDGEPLSKEWGIGISWLWFYTSIKYTKRLPYE